MPTAPDGLAVELLDDEFAVFSWPVEPPAATAALTSTERGILALVVAGESNARIATARGTSVRTVANQIQYPRCGRS